MILSKSVTQLVGVLNYGDNRVIIDGDRVSSRSPRSSTYSGFSFGLVLKFRLKGQHRIGNFLQFNVIAPIRSKQFKKDIESPRLTERYTPDVGISIGYHFGT